MKYLSKKISASAIFFIIISIVLIVLIGLLIYITALSPDAINRRNGVPESGWGGLVGGVILIPMILIFGVIDVIVGSIYFLHKSNKATAQPIKPNNFDASENKNIKVG